MINYTNLIINLIVFVLLFIFPLMIYLNILKYKNASLGLLVSNKNQTIRAFQIFAVAMILYAANMFTLILIDLYQTTLLKNIYIIISIIMAFTLIYVFYKLYRIMQI
jgi:hypothetical protein